MSHYLTAQICEGVVSMNTEIVCAAIALAGTVFSGILSWFVARSSADKEIQKMRLNWEHDKILSTDDDFSEMASAVAVCIQSLDPSSFDSALGYVAALRIKEEGPVSLKLDDLYDTLYEISPNTCSSPIPSQLDKYKLLLDRANDRLTDVINEKRKHKGA